MPSRVQLVGVLDHLEQRLGLGGAVDFPGGVEDLVAAVLGVGLREHHQLDVARVAPELREGGEEVVDLVLGEREAEVPVGCDEGGAAVCQQGHRVQRAGRLVLEEKGAGFEVAEHRLRHPVVELRLQQGQLRGTQRGEREGRGRDADIHGVGDDALDAFDGVEAAGVGDVGGLGGPGGDGARPRGDDLHDTIDPGGGAVRAVGEQLVEEAALGGGQFPGGVDHVDKLGGEGHRRDAARSEILQELREAEGGEGR
jgi:hypothetical protein